MIRSIRPTLQNWDKDSPEVKDFETRQRRRLQQLIDSGELADFFLATDRQADLRQLRNENWSGNVDYYLELYREWTRSQQGRLVLDAGGYFDDGLQTRDLLNQSFKQEWLVDDMLMSGRCGIAGGPFKTLKTTLLTWLALAVGSGTPFLGRLTKESSVLFYSGEASEAPLQRIAESLCHSFEIDMWSNAVTWRFEVPHLTEMAEMIRLRRQIRQSEASLVIIDPLYKAAGAVNSTSTYSVGRVLEPLSDIAVETGATIMLAHHANLPAARSGDPLKLSELHGAGVAEWARQWVLLNRRTPYDEMRIGEHALWLSYGGDAGHSGTMGVDVNEGLDLLPPCDSGYQLDEYGEPLKVPFSATCLTVDEALAADVQRTEQKVASRRATTSAAQIPVDTQQILAVMTSMPDGETERGIRVGAGLKADRFKAALTILVDDMKVEKCRVSKGNGQSYDGWKLVTGTTGTTGNKEK